MASVEAMDARQCASGLFRHLPSHPCRGLSTVDICCQQVQPDPVPGPSCAEWKRKWRLLRLCSCGLAGPGMVLHVAGRCCAGGSRRGKLAILAATPERRGCQHAVLHPNARVALVNHRYKQKSAFFCSRHVVLEQSCCHAEQRGPKRAGGRRWRPQVDAHRPGNPPVYRALTRHSRPAVSRAVRSLRGACVDWHAWWKDSVLCATVARRHERARQWSSSYIPVHEVCCTQFCNMPPPLRRARGDLGRGRQRRVPPAGRAADAIPGRLCAFSDDERRERSAPCRVVRRQAAHHRLYPCKAFLRRCGQRSAPRHAGLPAWHADNVLYQLQREWWPRALVRCRRRQRWTDLDGGQEEESDCEDHAGARLVRHGHGGTGRHAGDLRWLQRRADGHVCARWLPEGLRLAEAGAEYACVLQRGPCAGTVPSLRAQLVGDSRKLWRVPDLRAERRSRLQHKVHVLAQLAHGRCSWLRSQQQRRVPPHRRHLELAPALAVQGTATKDQRLFDASRDTTYKTRAALPQVDRHHREPFQDGTPVPSGLPFARGSSRRGPAALSLARRGEVHAAGPPPSADPPRSGGQLADERLCWLHAERPRLEAELHCVDGPENAAAGDATGGQGERPCLALGLGRQRCLDSSGACVRLGGGLRLAQRGCARRREADQRVRGGRRRRGRISERAAKRLAHQPPANLSQRAPREA
mmetsp:Transcript_88465/g.245686  ORF Transcript_88465/g.245686 Transcript_88465/m.245686 type:complete len:695 (+) Transcript_88465:67-2151(+)